MSKLNVDQKTIKELFQGRRASFLIPDYQRPYAWGENECRTLWDDIVAFAIPDEGRTKFDKDSEYFLGPIVTFKNERNQMEVIDGQQRLTTLMLLLRAFYDRFGYMQDSNSVEIGKDIAKCIWETDELGKPDKSSLKIDSEVAADNDRQEFLDILRTGETALGQKSRYAQNYRFFQQCIRDYIAKYPPYLLYLPVRVMNNCILLPIEAESQDTALRIFSTLNDRGMPLSDSDIFKAQFYKYFSASGQKDWFIKEWKELEELAGNIFHPANGTAMDELFTRYMYYVRAKMGNKSSTTEGLRKFYEKDGYALLKNKETFGQLINLAHFWDAVSNQDKDRFSLRVLRRLFVLNYAPNGMWTYIVSVFYMANKNDHDMLDDEAFYRFLKLITAFIWAYALTNPGVNALRTPLYAEMVNIVSRREVTFADFRFDGDEMGRIFAAEPFTNMRPITKAMLAWWAFQDREQELLPLETILEIEHIYARNRFGKDDQVTDMKTVESLGNKALLEKRINIRAADYRFADKTKYYTGFITSRNQRKEGTKIHELLVLARCASDFADKDIKARAGKMTEGFITFLGENKLLK